MRTASIAEAVGGNIVGVAKPKASVEAFVTKNLTGLARELKHWKKTGTLPNKGEGTLFEAGVDLVKTGDPFRDLETLVVDACIDKVSRL